uniref:AmmeMemoRadiSam system protein A n=1 Tax=Schlesneria paludicola TaxID=360056 RepID=A0A7C4LIX1_9PLAN
MSSVEFASELTDDERAALLDVVRRSIAHGLRHRRPLAVDATQYSGLLCARQACFVTLRLRDHLRGCMGSLAPIGPLIQAAAHHAFQAAFRDPRFPPVAADELSRLLVSLSILSPAEPLEFADEADLLARLRPGIDGVILSTGRKTATLLPQVWDHVPDRRVFLAHLKRKAGLPENYWSSDLRFQRYRAVCISESACNSESASAVPPDKDAP